jgi:dipeptidyl aminopeptidase/acylaminoacyl peptidase
MKKALAVSIIAAAAVIALAAAPLTPEQTLDRRSIGDVEFSPDGSRLVFTVTDPPKGSSRARALWLMDVASGQVRQLTFSGKSDGSPRWSPDGMSIAFTSDRDGAPQLYRLSLRGGDAEKLTDRKDTVAAFRWSPDGARIAVLMTEPKSDPQQQREKDKDDSRIVDKDDRHPRVWMLDVASKALTPITSGRWQIRQIEWLPTGDRLAAIATSQPEVDQFTDRLYTIALDAGNFDEIATRRGPLGSLAVSPDGKTLAYVGARVDGPEAHDLYLQPLAGGAPQNLTAASIDRPVAQPRWIDNQSLVVNIARGFKSALAIVGRDGRATTIDGVDVNPSSFARASSGTLAFVGETTTRAPELWLKSPNTPARPVTTVNAKSSSIAIVAPEIIKYKSASGVEIEAALLIPPADVAAPRSLPFVVLVHGGPTGRWSDSFEPWGQLLVSRGYAVLYPNVRGSIGYGQPFVESNRADWGGGDFKDVMAGVDAMIARGVADPNRLGIGGWSYGGYMAAWAVTQTTRFKAAVSGAPVIDMASEFGTENGSAYDEWFYGTPYEKLDGFIKSSPMTYVKHVKTPTLLLQGEDDVTDPIGQSQQFYRGLKRYHVESDLVLYPREGHGFREEKHLLDRLNRVVAWYDKYLKPQQPATAQ